MSLSVFPKGESNGCVSHWQLSLLLLDLAEPHVGQHVAVCPHCARAVAAEQQAVDMVRLAKPSSPLARSTAALRQWRKGQPTQWLVTLLMWLVGGCCAYGIWLWWQRG